MRPQLRKAPTMNATIDPTDIDAIRDAWNDPDFIWEF